METIIKTPYDEALIRIKRIKGFYGHVFIFLIFLVLWLLFGVELLSDLGEILGVPEHGFAMWIDINMWLTPLIWGAVVFIHGILIFGVQLPFFKRWEGRKMKEFMEGEVRETPMAVNSKSAVKNVEPLTKNEMLVNAKKRVKEIKGFHSHLFIYVLMNLSISAIKMILYHDINDSKSFFEALFHYSTYMVWIFWGVGLLFHAFKVYGRNSLWFENWERKKIEELMNKK